MTDIMLQILYLANIRDIFSYVWHAVIKLPFAFLSVYIAFLSVYIPSYFFFLLLVYLSGGSPEETIAQCCLPVL